MTYNGLERCAPIDGLTTIESTTPHSSYYRLNDHPVSSGQIEYNKGTDAKTYYVDASIFYIPDSAFIFETDTSAGSGDPALLTTKLYPGHTYQYDTYTHQMVSEFALLLH